MFVRVCALLSIAAAVGLALLRPHQPELSFAVGLVALLCLIEALRKRQGNANRKAKQTRSGTKRSRSRKVGAGGASRQTRQKETLIIDGSNVMFWDQNKPDLDTVGRVIEYLRLAGYETGVIFDASAGHVLFGRYIDDNHFADLLNLPHKNSFVVPKGTVADEYILRAANDIGARVVTNDRYRDWATEFPEVKRQGFLISGSVEAGVVKLHNLTLPAKSAA